MNQLMFDEYLCIWDIYHRPKSPFRRIASKDYVSLYIYVSYPFMKDNDIEMMLIFRLGCLSKLHMLKTNIPRVIWNCIQRLCIIVYTRFTWRTISTLWAVILETPGVKVQHLFLLIEIEVWGMVNSTVIIGWCFM